MTDASWLGLGAVRPSDLTEVRLELHHAAQIVAASGATFLEPSPDDSHPNLGWENSLGALVGRAIPGKRSFRAGLRVGTLELLLLDAEGVPLDALSLGGRTLAEARGWLADAIAGLGNDVPASGLTPPGYEIPDHPLAHGARFSRRPGVDLGEMARWLANGHLAITGLVSRVGIAGEVRCWPHHFDVGALLVLAQGADGSVAKSVGVGLSPGDDSYGEPYWYVSPWPYPDSSALSVLPSVGCWHTEGFTAAVLTGTNLLGGGAAAEQSHRTTAFLDAAIAASRRALE